MQGTHLLEGFNDNQCRRRSVIVAADNKMSAVSIMRRVLIGVAQEMMRDPRANTRAYHSRIVAVAGLFAGERFAGCGPAMAYSLDSVRLAAASWIGTRVQSACGGIAPANLERTHVKIVHLKWLHGDPQPRESGDNFGRDARLDLQRIIFSKRPESSRPRGLVRLHSKFQKIGQHLRNREVRPAAD